MRLSDQGYPVIILSHRRQAFLETALSGLRAHADGITDVIVVDDSGDATHHQWLDDQGFDYRLTHPLGKTVGYLRAMDVVWEVAAHTDSDYVLLWEEDFLLGRRTSLHVMAQIMDAHPTLAQLNLQRQPVYKIERRFGYMESHVRRGYGLTQAETAGASWVHRHRPFTTNPCLLRTSVTDICWPTRPEADAVPGGAEPAMSLRLEQNGYSFGWYGRWNQPHTRHLGVEMKTGKGY